MTAPLVLIIRDGWGENPHPEHDAFNAIKLARTPVDDMLRANYPHTLIRTSGEDVGVPVGTMGNSEVGHQNIGAGRIVDQEIMRITKSIRDDSFFEKKALKDAAAHVKRTGGSLHLLGLVSDGRVHSDIEHLFALIDFAKRENIPGDRLFIHAITDGRDVGPKTALTYIETLEAKLKETGIGRIASVIGRYYAMDRDHRWERTAAAYAVLTGRGEGAEPRAAATARDAVTQYYNNPSDTSRTSDEFIVPAPITPPRGLPPAAIQDHDAVIYFNFRGDRPRQITRAFTLNDDEWKLVENGGFDRGRRLDELFFCTMTGYEEGLPVSAVIYEKPPKLKNILGEVISNLGLTQFRCAETEKFAHVTFFFNDYREQPFPGEHRLLIPSPQDVSTYDQKPEMSAQEVCQAVIDRLNAPDCQTLIIVNFANPDMVGHSGRLDAVIRAVEVVDECVGRIVKAALARGESSGTGVAAHGASLIITADHGNAEQMFDPVHNSPHTAHTTYDVPLCIVTPDDSPFRRVQLLPPGEGRLADIAPTLLRLLGIKQPLEMTGRTFIQST